MHFHNPADNVSAMRYALHPDSSSARPAIKYPVFQAVILPVKLLFSDHHLSPLHRDPVQDPAGLMHGQLHLLSHRSYKNHADPAIPDKYPSLPADVPSPPVWPPPSAQTSGSSLSPSQTARKMQSAVHLRWSFLLPAPHADPDIRHGHFLPTPLFLHPASGVRLQYS